MSAAPEDPLSRHKGIERVAASMRAIKQARERGPPGLAKQTDRQLRRRYQTSTGAGATKKTKEEGINLAPLGMPWISSGWALHRD